MKSPSVMKSALSCWLTVGATIGRPFFAHRKAPKTFGGMVGFGAARGAGSPKGAGTAHRIVGYADSDFYSLFFLLYYLRRTSNARPYINFLSENIRYEQHRKHLAVRH
jgi:hypothetical protein